VLSVPRSPMDLLETSTTPPGCRCISLMYVEILEILTLHTGHWAADVDRVLSANGRPNKTCESDNTSFFEGIYEFTAKRLGGGFTTRCQTPLTTTGFF
jgi:hypothetical protein